MENGSGGANIFAYIGNWDIHKSPPGNGIGICRYDAGGGKLTLLKSVFPQISVGAVCVDERRQILYCTDECATLPGNFLGGGGQVYAFSIDRETGDLLELNHSPSFGSLPSHLAVDATGTYLVVTHHTGRVPITQVQGDGAGRFRIALQYDDATTVLFRLREDGSIGEPFDVFKHAGDGGPLPRQTHPQLHSVMMSPDGQLFVVCDKGNDEIQVFRIDHAAGKLLPCAVAKAPPGSSPRYSVFHPKQAFLFVNHETQALVAAYRYGPDGVLEHLGTVSSLPAECEDHPNMKQSDLKIHPSGKYLYSMIRAINAISVFAVDEASGAIERIQTVTLDGAGPRGCACTPDGNYLCIAAWESKDVLVWEIGADGRLSRPAHSRQLVQPHPGTVTFVAT
jgi:6-phosphogluconolactonase (cycloisomerase 2 family)